MSSLRRKSALSLGVRVVKDAVRATRLRNLINGSVTAGLAPPQSPLSRRHGVSIPLVHSARGCAEVAFARHVAMYLAHVVCRLTYTQAARLYGRDRTTAAYGCRSVESRRDDPAFDRILDLLERCVALGLVQIEPQLARQIALR